MSLINSTTVLDLYDMEISSEDIDAQLSKIEDDGEEKYRSETPFTKLLTPGMGELNLEP